MKNKINKQLKKGSPLFDLGQGISSLLDFEAIGRASNPNRSTGTDLMGRGLIHLGYIFSKMDGDFDPGETIPKPTDESEGDDETTNTVVEELPTNVGYPIVTELKKREKTDTPPPPPPPPPPVNSTPAMTGDLDINVVTPTETVDSIYNYGQQDYTGTLGDSGAAGLSNRTRRKAEDGKEINKQAETASSRASATMQGGFINYINNKVSSLFQRQKDDNPIKRLALEQPETFEAFKGLMYKRRYKEESPLRRIAHMHSSPFLRTDATDAQGVPDMSKVDYRYAQRAVIPEYAEQGFGQAAAEGFNSAIDRSNYKKAVQADYDKEVEDTMGELVIDSEYAGDSFNKQKLDFGAELKRQAYNDMVLYTKGEISFAEKQSRLDGYKNRAGVISAAGNALSELSKQVQDNKGLHDLSASKPENAAFYNTLRDNPGAFKMETIDGQEYIVGKTMVNGQPVDDVKMPLAQIANGKAALKLVPKTNPQTYVDAGLKVANGYVKEMATRFGIGKGNVSKEQIRPQMENYFMSLISQDETKLRSLAAQATDGKFDYDAFEQMINDPDPDSKKLNMQLLQNDIVQDMMLDFEAQYFPESQTAVRDPEKTGITTSSSSSKPSVQERQSVRTLRAIEEIGPITVDNVSQYRANLPEKIKSKGYTIVPSKKNGKFYIARVDPKTGKQIGNAEPFSKEAYASLLGVQTGTKLP